MKTKKLNILLLGMLAALPGSIFAQSAGITIQGMSGTNMTVAATTVYFPPAAYFNNGGNVYVGAGNIVAGNTAILTGVTGSRLHLLGESQVNPSAAAAATNIDLNGAQLNVDVTNYNMQNLVLADMGFGTVTADANANFTVMKNFNFATSNPFNGSFISNNDLLTGANKFIIGAAATLTGFDALRYVVTNDNAGELRKLGLTAGQSFFYPIGRAESDYSPARLQVQSGGTVDYYMNVRNFAESVPDENIGGYSSMPNVSRTWLVYASVPGTVANMDFIHRGTPMYEVNGYTHFSSNVIRYNASGWVPNLPNDAEDQSAFGTPANYWAQQITLAVNNTPGLDTYFGKSTSLVVLPVKLGEFSATPSDCDVKLYWNTLQESNLAYFSIERSYPGVAGWQSIAKVPSSGNSGTLKEYNFTDMTKSASSAYYRLAIVDNDGKTTYSEVRFARTDCSTQITAYPNPVTDNYNIVLPADGRRFDIRIVSANGQLVTAIRNASGLIKVDMTRFASGYYAAIITDNTGATTKMSFIKK